MKHAAGQDAVALWKSIREAVNSASGATLDRSAGCVAVAVGEMIVSAGTPQHRDVAAALSTGHGPCTVTAAAERACVTGAATANAYLMHARLADDSYRVAAHPGLAVVPVALAAAEWATRTLDRRVDGTTLLRSVIGGYECACRLADQLLPVVSQRGWRVTSVIAPLASAATTALLLGMPDEVGIAALGLASAASGGPLGVVSVDGDGWRLQPALAVQSGISAALAAQAGLRAGDEALTEHHGLYTQFGYSATLPLPDPIQGIHRVTFKRYPVAMYGQSIFDAMSTSAPIDGQVDQITVVVSPFAVEYGGQRRASPTSISSIPGIVTAAIGAFHPALEFADGPDRGHIDVVGDAALSELAARVEIRLKDGTELEFAGDGDTSGWDLADFDRHCQHLLGERGAAISEAAADLSGRGDIGTLLDLWRSAAPGGH
jgi:2-methylcitrate dehydratase PrpD